MTADALVLELAGGVRIAVPPDPRRLSTGVFLEQEDWFEDEVPFFRALARPGFRMLDVGASVGFYALTAAAAGGANGRVWAVEPTPEIATLLRAGVAANGFANVAVLEIALGDRRGEARLARHRHAELNRIVGEGDGDAVRLERLDDVAVAEGMAGVDFVKIDVEGGETAVIAGGAAFFARESPLVMVEVRAESTFDWRALDALDALGYAAFRLVPGLGILAPFSRATADAYLLNVFACKADRAAVLAAAGLLARGTGRAPVAAPGEIVGRLAAMPALVGRGARLAELLDALPAGDPQRVALGHAIAAGDPRFDAERRYAALATAVAAAREAVRGRSIARRLTAARLARDWGERSAAVALARGLIEDVARGTAFAIDAPFLPLLPAYESIVVGSGVGDWTNAMIVEATWRWSSFSDCMVRPPTPEHPADMLRRFGRDLPEFERRRQLRAIIDGRQSGPLPHPLLTERRPDHRNAAWWRGALSPGA